MAKKIQFVFDFNSKDVEIASDRTLTLAQQIKLLKSELQKTKEGTAEFDILRNKLNDTQDSFDRVNSKTQDLFGTLSLIPGPVGEIAGKLNGAVSLFKTFSNFSFKDLKTQFADVIDDLGGIITNIGKLTGITTVYAKINEVLAASFVKVGVGEQAAAVGARAFAAALTATGVGAIVVALGFAISALVEYAGAADDAAESQKELNQQQIDGVKAAKDAVLGFYKQEEDLAILRAKREGKSEEEIQKIREKYAKLRIDTQKKALTDLGKIQGANTAQQAQDAADAENELTKIKLEGDIERQRVAKEQAQKEKDRRKKEAEDSKQLAIDDLEARIQILKEGEATNAEELRKALEKQFALRNEGKKVTTNILKAQQLEIDKIVKDEIERDKKVREDRQNEIDQKNKERVEAQLTLERKLTDIRIAGISDEVEREKASRQEKLKRDIEDLNKDVEFQKKSEIEKAAVIANLRKAAEEDLLNITKNAVEKEKEERSKALDAQLEFLQLQSESITKGTQEYFALREEQLRIQQQKELEGVEKGSKEELAILQKYSALKKQLRQEETQAIGQIISASLDAFTNLGNAIASTYDEEAKTSEEAFNKRKKLQKSTALISAASGVVQILTQPSTLPSPLDFIVKTANALALGIATKAQIDKINATSFEAPSDTSNQQPRRLAKGGLITGEGGPESDMVPALLSDGESVINATSTQLFRPLLSTINEIGGGRRFANGGVVSNSSSQQQALEQLNTAIASSNTAPIKTYVVATDMTSQQMFDRAQKSRSTL